MMNRYRWLLVLIYISVVFKTIPVSYAQNSVSDSLLKTLDQPRTSSEQKIKTLVRISTLYAKQDPDKGLAFCQQALLLAKQIRNKSLISYTFSYLAGSYFQVDSSAYVIPCIDSAIWYADQTADELVKGIGWYKRGWIQNINNQIDSAVASWQKALDYLGSSEEGAKYRAGIFYLYFGIYAERGDLAKEKFYARKTLEQSERDTEHSLSAQAWQINGTAFLDEFEARKNGDSLLLDSALFFFKKSIDANRGYPEQLQNHSTLALSALFTAQVYMDYFPPWAKDSVKQYVNIALANTDTTHNKAMVINCLTILSKYNLQEGFIKQAGDQLLHAKNIFQSMDPKDYYIGENLYFELASLAEQQGNASKSLGYYKQYIDYYKKEFDAKQFETTKRLEAKYQAEKRDKEILLLTTREAFHKKQNYFYLGIVFIAVLGLIFMFLAYHFRLRYSLQREKMLEKEKEEAFLQSKLKEEEAVRLRLEKQEAELQSKLRTEESGRLQAEQQLLKARQEQLQKELLAGALQVEHKNDLLQSLKEKLLAQPADGQSTRQLERLLDNELRVDEDFEKIKSEFKDVYPDFFNRLQANANHKLTQLDLKYCAYIYMGLSAKQISSLLHVEPKSVRMSKYRIKQKLELGRETDLDAYIRKIEQAG